MKSVKERPIYRRVLDMLVQALDHHIDNAGIYASDPARSRFEQLWDGSAGILASINALCEIYGATTRDVLITRRYVDYWKQNIALGDFDNTGLLGGQGGILLPIIDAVKLHNFSGFQLILSASTERLRQTLLSRKCRVGDFGTGLSGGVCALIWASEQLGLDSRDSVNRLAAQLMREVEFHPNGIALHNNTMARVGPIGGLAHGTAGLAVGLLEVSRHLKDSSYQRIAISLCNFEESLRDSDVRWLWPEHRSVFAASSRQSSGTSWCYGSSGIGLVYRFFSFRMKSAHFRRLFLDTCRCTEAHISSINLSVAGLDGCVCHGVGSLIGLFNADGSNQTRTPINRHLSEAADAIIATSVESGLLTENPRLVVTLGSGPQNRRNVKNGSFFLGLGGLAVARARMLNDLPQYHLSMPFSFLLP